MQRYSYYQLQHRTKRWNNEQNQPDPGKDLGLTNQLPGITSITHVKRDSEGLHFKKDLEYAQNGTIKSTQKRPVKIQV
jgi:hypothetical protein